MEKVNGWINDIDHLLNQKRVKAKEVESLIERLNHTGFVIPYARYFINRIRFLHQRCVRYGPQPINPSTHQPIHKIRHSPMERLPTLRRTGHQCQLTHFHQMGQPTLHRRVRVRLRRIQSSHRDRLAILTAVMGTPHSHKLTRIPISTHWNLGRPPHCPHITQTTVMYDRQQQRPCLVTQGKLHS